MFSPYEQLARSETGRDHWPTQRRPLTTVLPPPPLHVALGVQSVGDLRCHRTGVPDLHRPIWRGKAHTISVPFIYPIKDIIGDRNACQRQTVKGSRSAVRGRGFGAQVNPFWHATKSAPHGSALRHFVITYAVGHPTMPNTTNSDQSKLSTFIDAIDAGSRSRWAAR